MSISIKRIGPKPPELNREYKKRPKPVTGTGRYIKVLETVYKPPKVYEFPSEDPERRKRIVEAQRKAIAEKKAKEQAQAEKPKRKETKPRIWTPEKIEQIKKLYLEGRPFREIGEIMGISKSAVNGEVWTLQQRGELPVRGRENAWTDEDVRKLLQMRADGKTFREIGETLGRSTNVCGNKYREVQGW